MGCRGNDVPSLPPYNASAPYYCGRLLSPSCLNKWLNAPRTKSLLHRKGSIPSLGFACANKLQLPSWSSTLRFVGNRQARSDIPINSWLTSSVELTMDNRRDDRLLCVYGCRTPSYPTSDFTAGNNVQRSKKKLDSETGPMICGQLPPDTGQM